jgi:hypothetical protein
LGGEVRVGAVGADAPVIRIEPPTQSPDVPTEKVKLEVVEAILAISPAKEPLKAELLITLVQPEGLVIV